MPEGLTGKWPEPSLAATAPQTVPDEKSARHTSNFGVPGFQKEPNTGTRALAVLGRGLYARHKGHLAPVLGEASSPDEPKKSMVTSTKNHYWSNEPRVKFLTSLEITGITTK